MRADTRGGLVMIAILAASILTTWIVWMTSFRLAWAGAGGLLMFFGLITAYSWLAVLFGWRKPRWSDLSAIGHLLP